MKSLENQPPTEDSEILALSLEGRSELLWNGDANPRVRRLIGRNGLLNLVQKSTVDSHDAELDDGITIIRGDN